MNSTRSISIWTISTVTAAIFWLGLAGTVAHAANKPDTNAVAAFDKLKTLSGTWEASSQRGKVTTSYEVISNGSALTERISVPGEGEMLTVYHLDGNRLVLTHYCTAGNQPHMQAEAYDPASNLRRLGRRTESAEAYAAALRLATNNVEQEYLRDRLEQVVP